MSSDRHPNERITYLFVTGDRRATGPEARLFIRRHLDRYDPHNTCLVHGGATGVDTHAADIAGRVLRWPGVLVIPARWEALSRSAGPTRNAVMVQMAVLLRDQRYKVEWLAFPGPKSKGTWSAINLAKKADFTVGIHPLDDIED